MPQKQLLERGRLLEATSTDTGAVRRPIQIITPGWGSSGYYSAEVLERAATEKVIPAGTHMYLNHASETERHDRPERDVEKIAAVLVEDAIWDGTRLIAEAELMGPHAELITALAPYIGVSISGSATDVTIGEAEGRTGPIIEGLAHVSSVDFVTHAGRGGMVLLESARPSLVNARAIGHGIAEATANETREQLQQTLRDMFGGEKSWVWVRDFDDSTVWYEHETPDESGTYGIAYEVADDGAVSLTGSPTEVRATTTYVPVARPGSNTPTEESQEDTMPNIEESELTRLREDAGRVTTLESERDTAVQERDQLRTDNARLRARETAATHARQRVTAANAALPAATVERIVTQATSTIPLTEAGELDTVALDTAVDTARTAEETYLAGLAEAAGVGSITGFGGAPAGGQSTVTEADIDAAVGGVFGRQVKEA